MMFFRTPVYIHQHVYRAHGTCWHTYLTAWISDACTPISSSTGHSCTPIPPSIGRMRELFSDTRGSIRTEIEGSCRISVSTAGLFVFSEVLATSCSEWNGAPFVYGSTWKPAEVCSPLPEDRHTRNVCESVYIYIYCCEQRHMYCVYRDNVRILRYE